MTRRDWALLAVGIFVIVVIIISIVAVKSCGRTHPETPPPKTDAATIAPKPASANPPVVSPATLNVSVSINAVPWAEVFIKTPGTNRFVKPETKFFKIRPEPNGTDSNITPIRGELNVPAGTEFKLIYEGKEETFPYESWKETKSISHDFLER